MVFQIKKPWGGPDVFIGVLTLVENTALNGLDGAVPTGTSPTNPGTCDVQMASNLFGPIWDFLPNHTKLSLTVAYDDFTRAVTTINVTSTLAVINTDLLEAGLSRLGNTNLSAGIESLEQIAGTLTQALAHFAPGLAALQSAGGRAHAVKRTPPADAE